MWGTAVSRSQAGANGPRRGASGCRHADDLRCRLSPTRPTRVGSRLTSSLRSLETPWVDIIRMDGFGRAVRAVSFGGVTRWNIRCGGKPPAMGSKEVTMATRTQDAEPLLTPAEVAAMFRVDPKTVTRWAKAGKLTSIRTLGGHRRYRESEVRELLKGMVPEQRRGDDLG